MHDPLDLRRVEIRIESIGNLSAVNGPLTRWRIGGSALAEGVESTHVARKPGYITEHTAGEVQELFDQLISSVGTPHYNARSQRVLNLPIDGVPLRDRRNEMRKRGTNFFSQAFVEALAVAQMLVGLDIDHTVEDIVRRERPDTAVIFSDRPMHYIEHTNVAAYEGMPFARHLEEINECLLRVPRHDEAYARFSVDGHFAVRLTDPGVDRRAQPEAIATEIAEFPAALPVRSPCLDRTRFGIRSSIGTTRRRSIIRAKF